MDKPWLKSYDPGVPAEIEFPAGMLVSHILEHSAQRFPNRPATIFPALTGQKLLEGRLSYRDLENAANRFANALLALGVQKGDRVALILPNSPQFLISYFGALKAGAIVVALSPYHAPAGLEQQLIDCGAETVVTMTQFYPTVKQVQANTNVTRVIATNLKDYLHPVAGALFGLARDKPEGLNIPLDPRDYSFRLMLNKSHEGTPKIAIRPEDLALLQYTSGATGTPRAAMLTHRSVVANSLQCAAWRTEAEPGHEVALCALPFFHPYGMQIAMLHSMLLGGALILVQGFDLKETVLAIDKYQPTFFPGVPAFYEALLNYPLIDKHHLRSLRTCFSGTAPLPALVQKAFEELTGGRLVEGYGLAEASPLTHANPIQGVRKEGSIGIPVPGTRARIVDPDFPGVELPIGEVGELAIQGPQVFKGYWNCPRETAEAFQGGWLNTGDLARMDEDGFFYLVQRKKDLITAGGFKVLPHEVEEVCYKHPKVQEAVVVGIKDPYLGEVPKAFIVLKEGEMASQEEMLAHFTRHLARYKVPRYVEFRSALPKARGGQVLRQQLIAEDKSM